MVRRLVLGLKVNRSPKKLLFLRVLCLVITRLRASASVLGKSDSCQASLVFLIETSRRRKEDNLESLLDNVNGTRFMFLARLMSP